MARGRKDPGRPSCLTDILRDGPSAVYSYFSLDHGFILGTYVILRLIDLAVRAGLPCALRVLGKGRPMDYEPASNPLHFNQGIDAAKLLSSAPFQGRQDRPMGAL